VEKEEVRRKKEEMGLIGLIGRIELI